MPGDEELRAAVTRIADTVRRQRGLTVPATEVLHRCGRYHEAALADIIRRLEADDIVVEPEADEARRWHTLRMQRKEDATRDSGDDAARAWVFGADGCTEADAADLPASGAVWIDLPPLAVERELPTVLATLLARDQLELHPEEQRAIVDDLAKPDHRPNRHVFGRDAEVRTLSAFEITADESVLDADEASDPSLDKTGVLELRLVELLVGPTWIVTVRFHSERVNPRLLGGALRSSDSPPFVDLAKLRAGVEKRWRRAALRNGPGTAGDLGIYVFHELTDSYRLALRVVEAWLTQWELQAIDPKLRTERQTLASLRLLLEEFESRVGPLAQPYHGDAVSGWFPEVTDDRDARHVLDVVEDALREIDRLQSRVRAAFDVLEGIEGDRQRQRLESFVAFLAVPTVITGFLGMNIWLPLNGRWWSFAIALAVMAGTTLAVYFALGHQRRARRGVRPAADPGAPGGR